MTIALFVVLLLAGTAAVIAPLARRPLAWPADPPDQRDDVAVFYLPPSVGDRAPGEPVTGTVPQTDALAALEVRASANPSDVPTQLALADAYVQAGRPQDAIPRYQAVLAKDPNNVAALDGLALILVAAGSNDGAIVAADRVIAQRPKDPDALFVKGLVLYRKQDWNGAVDVWTVYFDVGLSLFGSDLVLGLYADARSKAGR